jgi:hypothetical protein
MIFYSILCVGFWLRNNPAAETKPAGTCSLFLNMAAEARRWLDGMNLGEYVSALTADGYDDMLSFKSMTQEEVAAVSKSVGMKTGHAGKFRAGVQALQGHSPASVPAATPVVVSDAMRSRRQSVTPVPVPVFDRCVALSRGEGAPIVFSVQKQDRHGRFADRRIHITSTHFIIYGAKGDEKDRELLECIKLDIRPFGSKAYAVTVSSKANGKFSYKLALTNEEDWHRCVNALEHMQELRQSRLMLASSLAE